ncbi:MAG: ferritin-like protein [Planctomycetes bacterium]|nr:ferritin-like protein [Planctomycetota bacterium]
MPKKDHKADDSADGKNDRDLSIVELTAALKKLHALADAKQDEFRSEQVLCLKKSLQAAVTLEFATIPPYLSALWSIKDERHPAAMSIREVVQEEMLHMALACNMLASLGETPKIISEVPNYPSGLPGGVHEGLTVTLMGLSKESLEGFLWIERPVEQVPSENPYKDGEFDLKKINKLYPSDNTIGEFYEQIRQGFELYLSDPQNRLTTDNQISGPLAWTVIRNMDSVDYAIKLIQDQGEGSPNTPEEKSGDLSHYYRFLEVYNKTKYKWNPDKKKLEKVGDLPWPDTLPMAKVPPGGYLQKNVSAEVWHYLDKFDRTYSKLLTLLQQAWTVGGQAYLIQAYDVMFDLEWSAKPLMAIPIPKGDGGTYGPCWRYQPEPVNKQVSRAPATGSKAQH